MAQDRPTAAELLLAVRDLLEREVMPQLSGATRFHTRVSVNVLDIVARELELGSALDAAERTRLRDLLGVEGSLEELEALLAARIRDRSLDARREEVVAVVREGVRDKLRVAHPGYAGD